LATFAVLRSKVFLHPEEKSTLISQLKVTDNTSQSDCETIYALISSSFGEAARETYCQAAHEKFPFVSAFEASSTPAPEQ